MTPHIRALARDDVPRVVELIDVNEPGISHLFRADVGKWFAGGCAGGERYYVTEADGAVVGTLGYQPDRWGVRDVSWLVWGYVDPGWKRKGLASAMLARIEDELRAAGGRKLYLDIGNEAEHAEAIATWTRRGFAREGYLLDYWADGQDFLVYAKRL